MLLGIDWMDPNWLLDRFGTALFWISLLIVFVECGLFFPFLPGDTLLFALGLFIATGSSTCSPVRRSSSCSSRWRLLIVAAFLGNVVGYEIGRAIGPPLYERDGRILKRKYFDQTDRVLRQARQQGARHRPVRAVRADLHHRGRRGDPDGPAPLLPLEPGRRRAVGASITLLGYFLGDAFPALGENIDKAIIVILAFSVIPIAYEWWRHKRTRPRGRDNDRGRSTRPDITGRDIGDADRPRTELSRERRPGRPWSAPTGPRGRRRRAGSRPPGCGRSRRPRPRRSAPASRSARVASRTAPPVVITSSMIVTRRPATSGPSASLQVPYSLAFLRTNRAGRPVCADTMVAIGMPPSSSPPSSSVSSGQQRRPSGRRRGASRAGWASKRYLSK